MIELREATPRSLSPLRKETPGLELNYHYPFDREADAAYFMEKHGNRRGNPRRLGDEENARRLAIVTELVGDGLNWEEISRRTGLTAEIARGLHDPEWGARRRARRAELARKRRRAA